MSVDVMLCAGVRSEPEFGVMLVALIIMFGPLIAKRARLPGLIGLLVGGALVGPNTLGIIENSEPIESVGSLGVLYLIFLAGLELDLKTFRTNRGAVMAFGLATAAAPWLLGTVVASSFGYDLKTAILVGSFWASFTLVSYGVVTRYELTRVPSVAATVGASAITDTIGLVALAVIVGSESGSSGGLQLALEIVGGLVGVVVYTLIVLPLIVRWFFAGLGQERELRFVMVLAGFTSAAVVANALGIEALIGAFFAGVGLNRLVPNQSTLMARTSFFGNALFIPAFIVSVGLLVDPEVIADGRTLAMAAGFAAALVVGKAIAATVTARIHGFPAAETGLMFSLSTAQAAATLASTIIGFEIGLYEADVVNAVMLVIIVSLFVSAVGSARFAPLVEHESDRDLRLGETVVVPATSGDDLGAVLDVAARVAESDGGVVVPVVVSTNDVDEMSRSRDRIAELDGELRGLGLTAEPELRVDRSIAGGLARLVVERRATLVIVPWNSSGDLREMLLGGDVDEIAATADCPIALAALRGSALASVIVPIDHADLGPRHLDDTSMALALAELLAGRSKSPIVVGPAVRADLIASGLSPRANLDYRPGPVDRDAWLGRHSSPDGLVVTGARDNHHEMLRGAVADGRSTLVVSAHNQSRWYAPEGALGWRV